MPRYPVACSLALLALLVTACSEREIIGLELPADVASQSTLVNCTADVRAKTLRCAPVQVTVPAGVQADRILSGQEKYVKLASANTSYDSGTELFQSDVTVQNLIQSAMGTTDGTTPLGVKVFFHSGPTVTSGSGTASVSNPDGIGTFTGANQPYFQYSEILDPYEISAAKTWIFSVASTVNTFVFTVYIVTPLVDEGAPLLDAVWTGEVSTDWFTAGNWRHNAVPGTSSVVAVWPDTLQVSLNSPLLSANTAVGYLRVGPTNTLDLGTNQITVSGNVDASGEITNGTVLMSGADARLSGTVDALVVTGATTLQGTTTAKAAVAVSGTLTVSDRVLTISTN